jgi:phospholipase/lecithinase/hemolysin
LCGKANAFTHLVVFGDSLSDTGNLASLIGLPSPYYQNRISNGPVAVDVVAARLGLSSNYSRHIFSSSGGENYAVGGANAGGNDIQDLNRQLTAFQSRHPVGLGPDALYIMMIGGNDVRDARGQGSATQRAATVSNAVTTIRNGVQRLISLGARNIVVVNSADISRIPETLQAASTDPGIVFRARDATQRFNTALGQMYVVLKNNSNINIALYDLYGTINQILNNPAAFGFTNSTQHCFDPDSFQLVPGCDFSRFVFFDRLHPTSKTHGIVAQHLLSTVTSGSNSVSPGWIGAIQLLLE